MMPSNLPRVGAFALTLAFGLTGCGLFTVQDGVAAKAVKVDLVFGAPSPSQPPEFQDPGNPFGDQLPPPPPLPVLPPAPPDPGLDLCPPTTAQGARDPTVSTIDQSQQPQEDDFLTATKSQIEGQPPTARVEKRIIKGVEPEQSFYDPTNPDRFGFQYFVEDTFNGVEMQFLVYTGEADEQVEEGGIYLKSITIPTHAAKRADRQAMTFITPQPHLKLVDFGIAQGTELTSEAGDVSGKPRTIDDPSGEPVVEIPGLVPSPNSISTTTVVGAIDNKVQVCADLGAAYRVSLDLKITGEFQHRLIGTFWLAPQYGGWPIKDDYFMFGDLLEGVFSNNIMELPPAQCEDKLDNDGDGKVDFAGTNPDPQCTSPKDNDESS
ncbi:MAG TPA: hypothetical protein VGB52_08985 [Actinomycetota bacterium]